VLAIVVGALGLVVGDPTGDVGARVIIVLLAAYLWVAAGQALRSGELLARIPAVELATLLRPGLLVPADISVAEALSRVWSGGARGLVLVDAQDRPSAIVAESRIGEVPPERRPWTPLATVARALEPGLVIPVSLSGSALIDAVRATPASEYLVVNSDGSPAGILAITDLAATLKGAA
jgi:CBS domain containing-hemolysin-like protein